MAGSTLGTIFKITTWGESHGKGIGVVIDGCPAGLPLCEEDVQIYLNRRKPGQSKFTTPRAESDKVQILSGVFEGHTTGTPVSMIVMNQDQRSRDYGNLASCYRPGHADYTYDQKYGIGIRDYRGGGRSSGRETIGRVAAGAVAALLLKELGITVQAYTRSIGPYEITETDFSVINDNPLYMPDADAARKASAYLEECIRNQNSSGGVIECRIHGVPAGLGDPAFEKLNANLAKSIGSIGAVKGFEIGDGFAVAKARGSENNDPFRMENDKPVKSTNHAGGILGGISDGSEIILRAAIKPTPSISRSQQTVDCFGNETDLVIHGRHDPVIVPRAVVVVESMAAITILDELLINMTCRLDRIKEFYKK